MAININPILILLTIRAIIIVGYDEIIMYRENKDYNRRKEKFREDSKARIKERNRLDKLSKEGSIKEE